VKPSLDSDPASRTCRTSKAARDNNPLQARGRQPHCGTSLYRDALTAAIFLLASAQWPCSARGRELVAACEAQALIGELCPEILMIVQPDDVAEVDFIRLEAS